jgi:hypothetical protein
LITNNLSCPKLRITANKACFNVINVTKSKNEQASETSDHTSSQRKMAL